MRRKEMSVSFVHPQPTQRALRDALTKSPPRAVS
jgi:hypothetical protein